LSFAPLVRAIVPKLDSRSKGGANQPQYPVPLK